MLSRVTLALLRPTVRAIRWPVLGAAAAVGLAIVAVPSLMTVELQADDLTTLLRVAAVAAALGMAFVLDDPAARTIEVVPTARLLRRAVCVAVALPVAALWWAVALTMTIRGAEAGVGSAIPGRGLTLEALTLVVAALALAALGARSGAGGAFAAPALLIVAVVISLLPARVALFVPPEADWTAAHQRWAVLLAATVVGFGSAAR